MRCEEEGCFREVAARQFCNMHYLRRKRAGDLGVYERKAPRRPSVLERLAQEGRNERCVDCGDVPLFGGMRCLDCFRVRCAERSDRRAAIA